MALTPEEQAQWEQMTGRSNRTPSQFSFSNPFEGKSVTDFIPNVFGRTAPANYQGLLSAGILTPEQVAQTQKTANIQGLLGAGLALAQGMSRTGPRRSGAQNILSALGAGFGASGGAYQQGLQDFSTQQQLQSAVMQQRKALQSQQAIEKVIQSPEVANNPTLVAYFRANPDKALEHYMKRQMVQEARLDPNQPPQIAAQPSAQPSAQVPPSNVELGTVPPPGEEATKFLPEVPTITKASQYEKQAAEADRAAQYYANIGENKTAEDLRKEADYFRGLFNKEGLVTNIESSLADVDPTLRPRANALINNAPGLTQEQIQSRLDSILTDDANLKQELDFRIVEKKLKEAAVLSGQTYQSEQNRFNRASDLRKEYQGIPVVKDFQTVQVAFNQINNALSKPSAANDLAAATKFMKLLDPGSVVRESELGMAMAATGALDRAQNYFNMLQTGQKLTASQREDFRKAAISLYNASEMVVAPISEQYKLVAEQSGVNPNSVVFPISNKAPVVNKQPATGAVRNYNPATGRIE
jgi:hypothetical protein